SLPTDFSFARLDNARFIGTRFTGTTYLTYASLTCADFSSSVLNNGNAVFGDSSLKFDPDAPCRAKFHGAQMNCEFLAQWDRLDLTGADISACTDLIQPGHDFSG